MTSDASELASDAFELTSDAREMAFLREHLSSVLRQSRITSFIDNSELLCQNCIKLKFIQCKMSLSTSNTIKGENISISILSFLNIRDNKVKSC